MKKMNEFQHFVITRFNLRDQNWDNLTKSKNLILTESWLTDRFELFENYCFPSVMNQSNTNFEWWVFFDFETPKPFLDRINLLKKKFDKFIPIFIDGMDSFLPTIQKRLSSCDSSFIITSRLDNDDCIRKDFVEKVQSKFNFQEFMAFDFVDGFTIQIQTKVNIGYRCHVYNPFITLIEKNDEAKSVWSRAHSDWKREGRIKRVRNERIWMSLIHQDNKVNEYFGFGRPNLRETLVFFGIDFLTISELELRLEYSNVDSIRNFLITIFELAFKDIKRNLGVYKIK